MSRMGQEREATAVGSTGCQRKEVVAVFHITLRASRLMVIVTAVVLHDDGDGAPGDISSLSPSLPRLHSATGSGLG